VSVNVGIKTIAYIFKACCVISFTSRTRYLNFVLLSDFVSSLKVVFLYNQKNLRSQLIITKINLLIVTETSVFLLKAALT